MATIDDIRRIVLALPETEETVEGHRGGLQWRTKKGGVIWERGPGKRDLAQLAEMGRDWPEGITCAVRVETEEIKDALIVGEPDVFFTIPHFDGYPAVLFVLDRIAVDDLRDVIVDAWLLRVSPRTAKAWLAGNGESDPE